MTVGTLLLIALLVVSESPPSTARCMIIPKQARLSLVAVSYREPPDRGLRTIAPAHPAGALSMKLQSLSKGRHLFHQASSRWIQKKGPPAPNESSSSSVSSSSSSTSMSGSSIASCLSRLLLDCTTPKALPERVVRTSSSSSGDRGVREVSSPSDELEADEARESCFELRGGPPRARSCDRVSGRGGSSSIETSQLDGNLYRLNSPSSDMTASSSSPSSNKPSSSPFTSSGSTTISSSSPVSLSPS